MSYGAERLIAAREGPNNRRAFDEVRLLYRQGAVSVDAFFGNPVEIDRTGAFDDWAVPGCGSGVSTRRCRFIRCREFDRISTIWA